MKRLILILCGIAVMSYATANAKTSVLQGEHLRKTIAGKTVHLNTGMGFELPIAYRHNGTMAAKTQAMTAALAGEARPHDSGKWWITESELCQRWQNWLQGKTHCFVISLDGSTVHWRSNSGRSGTARISH
jgi:hypothetical protein